MTMPPTIALIGSGGVATSIVAAVADSRPRSLRAIYSRQIEHAVSLKERFHLDCLTTDQLSALPEADLYVTAVSDQAIPEVAMQLPKLSGLIVHTSAVTPIEVFSNQSDYGVWYPFNTYSPEQAVPFQGQKVLYELSAGTKSRQTLARWNELLQVDAVPASLEQRLWLHLAGVFACNFTNRLYTITQRILAHADLPEGLANALILQTANKAARINPYDAQTGPARRHDLSTIARHEELLTELPSEVAQIYHMLTRSILEDYPA